MFVALGIFTTTKINPQTEEDQVVYLMYLLPTVLIHAADLGMIVQQQLAAVGVPSNHGAVIEGRQSSAVLVVRWRA